MGAEGQGARRQFWQWGALGAHCILPALCELISPIAIAIGSPPPIASSAPPGAHTCAPLMYIESWDSFYQQAEELYLQNPLLTRYVTKYRHCDGKLVLKVTDDKTVGGRGVSEWRGAGPPPPQSGDLQAAALVLLCSACNTRPISRPI